MSTDNSAITESRGQAPTPREVSWGLKLVYITMCGVAVVLSLYIIAFAINYFVFGVMGIPK